MIDLLTKKNLIDLIIRMLQFNILLSLYYSYIACGPRHFYKLPILVGYFTQIKGLRNIKFDQIRSRSLTLKRKSKLLIHGKLHLKDMANVHIGDGSGVFIDRNAQMVFNGRFTVLHRFKCNCLKHISIGDDVLFSWDVQLLDTDFHTIVSEDGSINHNRPITIGDKVWIGCDSLILKGTEIASGSVIGARSVVAKKCLIPNAAYVGNPAKLVKRNIAWNIEKPVDASVEPIVITKQAI